MPEESAHAVDASPGPLPDPVVRLPKAVRPVNVVLGLGLVYLVGAAGAGTALIAVAWRDASEGVAAWGIAGAIVGVPLTLLLAWAGARAERVLTGRTPPARWLWVPFAWGVAMSAHWAPLCPWPIALWGAAIVESGRAERYLGESTAGLVAWAGVLVGVGVLVPVSRALVRRRWAAAPASAGLLARVPTSLLVGSIYGLAVAIPALGWIGWLQETWGGASGSAALVAWILLGAGAGAGAGAACGTWLQRAAPVVPALATWSGARRGEIAGIVAAAHWVPAFLLALTPALERTPDIRYSLLICGFFAILTGTALWSGSRAVRSPLAVP